LCLGIAVFPSPSRCPAAPGLRRCARLLSTSLTPSRHPNAHAGHPHAVVLDDGDDMNENAIAKWDAAIEKRAAKKVASKRAPLVVVA
jgi:hypothetical protein